MKLGLTMGVFALAAITLVTMIIGCSNTVQEQEFQKKLDSIESLLRNQPGDPIKFSMDRYLLNQRNQRFNDPNKMCYLYICCIDGNWLKVTIAGKVTSTSKRLSRDQQWYSNVNGTSLGSAPDDMGTYGITSGDAKVGMSTLGSLLEYGGMCTYFISEVPLKFSGMNKPMAEIEVEVSAQERSDFLKKLEILKGDFNK